MDDSEYTDIQVECYSGYKADERPVAFTHQGVRREIMEIADRWYEGGVNGSAPVIDYFKVRDTDGNVYLLRHRSETDAWSLRR